MINTDALAIARSGMYLPHEATPIGVPAHYGWAKVPKLHSHRTDMAALTGWLHAFSTGGKSVLQMTEIQTWYRKGLVWTKLQGGSIGGAVFDPSFVRDVALPPATKESSKGITTATWETGAWHCWPDRRAPVPAAVDEFVTICQVRAVGASVLVGAGIDYWRTMTTQFVDGTESPAIALGRIVKVSSEWKWVGVSSQP